MQRTAFLLKLHSLNTELKGQVKTLGKAHVHVRVQFHIPRMTDAETNRKNADCTVQPCLMRQKKNLRETSRDIGRKRYDFSTLEVQDQEKDDYQSRQRARYVRERDYQSRPKLPEVVDHDLR